MKDRLSELTECWVVWDFIEMCKRRKDNRKVGYQVKLHTCVLREPISQGNFQLD